MPLGTIIASFPYNARLWNEGEITSGAPLRFVAPVPEMYGGSVWEQNPRAIGDTIEFPNLMLNSGAFTLIWLVAESPSASNNVEIYVGDVLWMHSIDLTSATVQMREISVFGNVLGPDTTVRFVNQSTGFIAATRFSIRQSL